MEALFVSLVAVAVCLALVVMVLGAALTRVVYVRHTLNTRKSDCERIVCHDASCPPTVSRKHAIQPTVGSSFFDSLGASRKKKVDFESICLVGATDKSGALGKINFGLSFEKQTLTLSVNIIQASNLAVRDAADTCVRACLVPDTAAKLTRVQKRSKTPKYSQTLSFQCLSAKRLQEMTLCLQVLDYERYRWEDPVGEVLLPLHGIKLSNCPVYWKNLSKYTIRQEGEGEILVSLRYTQETSRITVGILKGKDLPAKDSNGLSDPYVKIWLMEDGMKIEKKKTSTKPCTLVPTFNESFTFNVNGEKLGNVQLLLTVMDHDVVTRNDEIGYIVFGRKGSDTAQKHWKEMVDRPGYDSSHWHRLCSPEW